MKKFEKTVYVSHKYGGDKNNLKEVEEIIRTQQKKHPNYMFISPLHMFSFLYNDMSYEDGLELCLYQLSECDEIWVTGEKWYDSTGVIKEIEYANAHKIDVLFVKNAEDNPHKVEGYDYVKGLIDGIKANKVNNDEASMTTAPVIHKYDNVCENTKSAYIDEDNIIRTYIAYNVVDPLVRNFMNICGVQILTKCPFCKSINKITLKDRSPVSTPCNNCHNLLNFSHLTYGDILRKHG